MGVPFNRTPEGLLDFRRFGGPLPSHCLRRQPPLGSSSFTHSIGRFAATSPRARSRSMKAGSSSPLCSTPKVPPAESPRWTSAPWSCAPSRPTPSSSAPAATEPSLESPPIQSFAPDQLNQHFISREPTTRTASSSRSIPPPSPAKTSSASCPNQPAAKVAAFGSEDKNDKRAAQSIPEGDRWYFLEEMVPQVRQPRPARRRHPRHLQGRLRTRHGHRRSADGLPRRLPPRAGAPEQARKASLKSTRSSLGTIPAKFP